MPDEPVTALNHYRLLGRSGLRVSPLCLGTMTFNNESSPNGASVADSRRILDIYLDRGGNYIDTANVYVAGKSEEFLGETLQDRRDRVVLATKYTMTMRDGDPNAAGNQRKNMVQSLEASLRRLRTDYVDLYYVHAWDGLTPVDEIMRGLDDLVRQGKILHAGISDAPAWEIARANTLADLRGWSPFVALQIEYSLTERTVERDLVPMARALGLAVCPWSPLGGGLLTGKFNPLDKSKTDPREDSVRRLSVRRRTAEERNMAIARRVQEIARDLGRSPAQGALNGLVQRPGVTSGGPGARRPEQLEDNLGCLDFKLPASAREELDEISAITLGFPHDFLGTAPVAPSLRSGTVIDPDR